jgi:hypothetical protein
MHMLATRILSRALAPLLPTCLLLSVSALAQQPPGLPSHLERDNLVFEGMPPLDAKMAARLDRYQQSRQATFLDWEADGGMLVATRFGDVEQIHRVASPALPPQAAAPASPFLGTTTATRTRRSTTTRARATCVS